MAGPLPPAVGGMATVCADLAVSVLAHEVDLVLFNTAKTTRPNRSWVEAFTCRVVLWAKWWRLIKQKPNTIAHVHTCSGLTFFLDGFLVALAKMCAVPVVLHIHGGRFAEFLDGLPWPLLALARSFCRRCDRVLVLTETWQKTLATRLGRQNFCVMANGVSVNACPVRCYEAHSTCNLLFLGSLSSAKGVLDLLAALPHVDNAVLHLVGGEGEPGILENIKASISQYAISHKVKLHGTQVGEEKQRFLEMADIFVLPSHAEGLPLALLEAMATGLPSVATTVGGIPEVMANGKEGLLVAPGQPRQLALAIDTLVKDPTMRRRMGESAKQRCIAVFSIDSIAQQLAGIYRQVSGH